MGPATLRRWETRLADDGVAGLFEFERTDRTISRAESIGKMQISILLF